MSPEPSDSNWRDLGVRAAAAAVMIPLVLGCAWLGGAAYEIMLLVMGGLMIWEWCRLVFVPEERRLQIIVFSAGFAASFAFARSGLPAAAIAGFAITWVLSLGLAVWRGGSSIWRLAGVPYIILPLLAMFYLRLMPVFGLIAVFWLFFVVWSTDTFAYFSGRTFGGPKLSPRFSPNKTWSGLLGGMAGAGVVGGLVAAGAGLPGIIGAVALGAVVAAVSQIGDIFESAAKRHFNVKDSGALIPGHGGILDRVDGLLFAAVFCAGVGFWRHGDIGQVARYLL